VLAYCRVSSIDQETHGTSLDGQRDEIARWCTSRGYPKPVTYVETESGAGTKGELRVQQVALMRSVRVGDLVVVAKQDRWSRDVRHFLESVDGIIGKGARFVSLAESFDASTPEGRFAMTVMASTSELERARIRERTVGTRRRLRKLGLWVEGRAPLGYTRDDTARKLVVDRDGAAVVLDMFSRCIAGQSTREIAAAFAVSHPHLRGLDSGAIGFRLRDRRYLGQNPAEGRKGRKTLPGVAWIDSHPAIVDALTFRRAQDMLDANRLGGAPLSGDPRNAIFVLRGLVHCAHCGATLVAHAPDPTGSVRHAGWYLCRHRPTCGGPCARQDEVDPYVDALVRTRLQKLATLLSRPAAKRAVVAVDFVGERARVRKRQENLITGLEMGAAVAALVAPKMAKLDAMLADIDRREIEHAAANAQPTKADRRQLLASVTEIAERWARMKPDARRRVVEMLADKITLERTTAEKWARGAWALHIEWKGSHK